ncbi:hypothetical protein [Nocardiopsis trehalosi]|jgi:hypothetical protein|uniref:hypothetical protein n=1 Tax=Nocardiopsis trehalosi TaxID=109329 RepID=UPI00082B9EA7|nr:hypothetical protein [Nocardiopsis trehalosi]
MREPIAWEDLDDDQLLAAADRLIAEEPIRPEVVALYAAILGAGLERPWRRARPRRRTRRRERRGRRSGRPGQP